MPVCVVVLLGTSSSRLEKCLSEFSPFSPVIWSTDCAVVGGITKENLSLLLTEWDSVLEISGKDLRAFLGKTKYADMQRYICIKADEALTKSDKKSKTSQASEVIEATERQKVRWYNPLTWAT